MSNDDLREWIRERIDDHIDVDDPSKQTNPWSSKSHVRQDIQYGEYDRDEVVQEIESMVAELELINWHGWVAPRREENLVAIIEAERAADITRKILIGKCNRARRDLDERDDESAEKAMTDGGTDETERCQKCGYFEERHPMDFPEAPTCDEFSTGTDREVRTDGGTNIGERMFPGLSEDPSDSLPDGVTCTCSRTCSPSWSFCPWCGHPLDDTGEGGDA